MNSAIVRDLQRNFRQHHLIVILGAIVLLWAIHQYSTDKSFFPEKFKKIQALHSIQYSKLQNTTQFFHEKFSQLSLGSENYYSAWFHSDQLSKLNSLSLEKRNEYKGRADLYLKKLQGN